MKHITALMILLTTALGGCGGESHQDLRDWMRQQGEGARGKVEPLPQVRPYEPFTYNAFDLPDPYKPRKIETGKPSGESKLQPDFNRRREPLEAYPLETVRMVGTLQKGRAMYALLKTTDRNVFQVREGNYVGQNFGVIMSISDTELKLRELIQDGAGEWTERTSTLFIEDAEAKQEQKK